MIQVHVTDNMMVDGVAIYICMKHEGDNRRLMHITEAGYTNWELLEQTVPIMSIPTMSLNSDVARALLDALLRHYQGASDMHTVRADLIHERGRVDKLVDHVVRLNQSAADLAEKAVEALGTG